MLRVLKYTSIAFILVLVVCLGAAIPAQAADLSLNVSSGIYQSNVTVHGTAFQTGETITDITFDNETVVDSFTLSGSTTSFSKTFKVPSAASNVNHTITAIGELSGEISSDFTVEPSITLSTDNGMPGDSLTVTGYGFGASETDIRVTFSGTAVGSFKTASTLGYWTNTITVPTMASGTYDVAATGDITNSTDVAVKSYKITVNSVISISKTSGTTGTSVTINGSGFAPNESGVKVTFNGNMIGSTPVVNASGTWSLTFNIPPMAGGNYIVDAYGSLTQAASVADQAFTVQPQFSISPATGATGTLVTATGSGYGSNETINLTYDSTPFGASVNADANGSWSSTFAVPVSSSGSHKIAAGNSTTAQTFTVGSSISVNKSSGIAGTSVTVSGTSFAANETGIVVTLDGNPIGSTVQAGATGSWTATVTIPPSSGGEHSIGAHGKTTPATAISESPFTVLPVLGSLSKTSGQAGTTVTLSGTSFAANEKINITYDGVPLEQSAQADENGAWTSSFAIPPSAAGNHTIKVSGSTTGSTGLGNLTFKILSAININPDKGTLGTQIEVSGSGYAPGSPLKVTLDDSPFNNLGTVTINDMGEFDFTFKIPKIKSGQHTIKVADNQNNSGTIQFSIDSTPPSVPKPLSPSDGETIGFTGNINPTFTWSKSTGTSDVTYTLQISSDSEFGNPQLEKTDIAATKYTLSKSESLPKGDYFWRIKAVDAASNESDWSRPFELKSGVIASSILTLLIIVGILIIAAIVYFVIIRPLLRRRAARREELAGAGAGASEIIIPEVVNAEYRQLDTDEATKKRGSVPWRLALPQSGAPAAKGGPKALSSEDQARLKVIIEFAKSLPLVDPGYNTGWLVEMAESTTGSAASPTLYAQMLKGEVQIQYEPAWMRHPTFVDLQTLLEGQPIIQDLNAFVDSVNHAATDGMALLQDIYRETTAEITWDILPDGGWDYISAVYIDSLTWYQGKNLREPSDKDYTVKAEGVPGENSSMFGLYAEPVTAFAGLLVKAMDENDAGTLRTLHVKLRKTFRNNDKACDIVHLLTQLEVQRGRLINAFSQFSKLNP